MAKFKIGNRVRTTISSLGYRAGETGTVREDHVCPWVDFDEPGRFRFASPELDIPRWHGCCVHEDNLTLIAPAPTPRTRAEIEAEIKKLQAELTELPRKPERLWGIRGPGTKVCDQFAQHDCAVSKLMGDGDVLVEFVEVMK